MNTAIQLILWHFDDGGGGPIIVYEPSLDFSDARNSQYCSLWG